MKSAGPVVWLHVSAAALAVRLQKGRSVNRRPSLTGKPIADEVAEVLAFREPLYRECASLIVDAEFERPEQVAARIARGVRSGQTLADSLAVGRELPPFVSWMLICSLSTEERSTISNHDDPTTLFPLSFAEAVSPGGAR